MLLGEEMFDDSAVTLI